MDIIKTPPTEVGKTSLPSPINPQSLGQLFSKDPEELSDTDIDQMVAEYRDKRKLFIVAEDLKASKPKQKRGTKVAPPDFSIDDLLL